MIKMHEVDNLIKFKHPDVIFLTETFLLKRQHNHLSRILAKGFTPLYSSLDAKGRGRPRGGVAVIVSSDWARTSAIKQWAGKSIPGYLDGVEVLTSDGLSHTLLAAYEPPGSEDTDLAIRVRTTMHEASVRSGDRLVTAGDFNGVMTGERWPPSPGDRAHANLIQHSGLTGFSARRRVPTYVARSAASGTRIDDCLVGRGAPAPFKEKVLLPDDVFPTTSMHRPLVSKVLLFPPKKGPSDVASQPALAQPRHCNYDVHKFDKSTETALSDHLASDPARAPWTNMPSLSRVLPPPRHLTASHPALWWPCWPRNVAPCCHLSPTRRRDQALPVI